MSAPVDVRAVLSAKLLPKSLRTIEDQLRQDEGEAVISAVEALVEAGRELQDSLADSNPMRFERAVERHATAIAEFAGFETVDVAEPFNALAALESAGADINAKPGTVAHDLALVGRGIGRVFDAVRGLKFDKYEITGKKLIELFGKESIYEADLSSVRALVQAVDDMGGFP